MTTVDNQQLAAEREMQFFGRFTGSRLDPATPAGLREWAENMDFSTTGYQDRVIMTGDVQAFTAGRIAAMRLARVIEALEAKNVDEGLTAAEEHLLNIAIGEHMSSE